MRETHSQPHTIRPITCNVFSVSPKATVFLTLLWHMEKNSNKDCISSIKPWDYSGDTDCLYNMNSKYFVSGISCIWKEWNLKIRLFYLTKSLGRGILNSFEKNEGKENDNRKCVLFCFVLSSEATNGDITADNTCNVVWPLGAWHLRSDGLLRHFLALSLTSCATLGTLLS